ncbi:LptF/LptG family permease [Rapidithrix thailandica]|uniref:LptF/LptG family permease n=1 Tax=Rapidithrix thailandica TaxID=413964 RepID=A0AAW9S4Z9_9BACT
MIKKIDKLILRAYIGPLVLTFAIIEFILLMQMTISRFKDFLGKDLGFDVFGEFFFYFALILAPMALPLAILLASLMTFGSLGEHSELSAIKGSGISLLRVLRPAAILTFLITCLALYFNDQILPVVNLKGYSLLYDVKQKKPALNIEEGVFYNEIPGRSIYVKEKTGDGSDLRDVMIYDHSKGSGNKTLITAEAGRMELVNNEEFLKINLYQGRSYAELSNKEKTSTFTEEYMRDEFDTVVFMYNMDAFSMGKTKEELFLGHGMMKTAGELVDYIDSLKTSNQKLHEKLAVRVRSQYYFDKENPRRKKAQKLDEDEAKKAATIEETLLTSEDSALLTKRFAEPYELSSEHITQAVSRVESANNTIRSEVQRMDSLVREKAKKEIDFHRIFNRAVAILVMFLIGAPLGAIIKKGGLGVPVLVAIIFFVIYYICTIMGEKFARELAIDTAIGCWVGNAVLSCFGLFFLRQAKNDARLFDTDFYNTMVQNINRKLLKRPKKEQKKEEEELVQVP